MIFYTNHLTNHNHFGSRHKRDVVVKWGLRLSSAIILGCLAVVIYMLAIDRATPLVVHSGEVIEYDKQPDNSWIFVVRWHGEMKRKCGGVSKRWLVDGFRMPIPDFPYMAVEEAQPLGPFTWEVPVPVPSYFVTTGHQQGTYRAQFLHHCNALQELIFPIVVEPPPIPFVIPEETPSEINGKSTSDTPMAPGNTGPPSSASPPER